MVPLQSLGSTGIIDASFFVLMVLRRKIIQMSLKSSLREATMLVQTRSKTKNYNINWCPNRGYATDNNLLTEIN